MEELYELRRYIEMGDTAAALALLDEMDEMSQDDKIQKIASFTRVLLVHMIKQAVEHRTTKSWEVSIRHALRQIAAVNTRRKAGGWYVSEEELRTLLDGVYESALDWASLEAHEGIYSASELAARVTSIFHAGSSTCHLTHHHPYSRQCEDIEKGNLW